MHIADISDREHLPPGSAFHHRFPGLGPADAERLLLLPLITVCRSRPPIEEAGCRLFILHHLRERVISSARKNVAWNAHISVAV